MHAGFCRRAPTFLAIARHAARGDVLPILAAAVRDRHDVIEGELARRKAVAAVLAAVIVACVDVRARKWHVVEAALYLDVAEQPDDRRQLEADRHAPDVTVVDRDDLDLPLAPQRDGLLPVNDLERLIRRVEE